MHTADLSIFHYILGFYALLGNRYLKRIPDNIYTYSISKFEAISNCFCKVVNSNLMTFNFMRHYSSFPC